MPEVDLVLVLTSFVAGLMMFFAPCTLPLVPAYLAFIGGQQRQVLKNAVAFVAGFTFVFVVLGLLVGAAGSLLYAYQSVLVRIGGACIIFLALMLLFDFRAGPLKNEYKLTLPKSLTPGTAQAAFLIGLIFALGWSPCIGPVLGTIFVLAAASETVAVGAILLLVFSLGQAIPFLLVAFFYNHAVRWLARYTWLGTTITKIGAAFLLLVGLLLLTDSFGVLLEYGYLVFNYLGLTGIYDYL